MDNIVSLSQGDLSKTIEVSELHRDFVEIGEALNNLSISLDLGLRNISDTIKQIAKGDFSTDVEWEMPGIYNEIIKNINSALKNAYDVDRDRKEALEQLAANLTQFETSADKLRNPLAVMMTSLELKDELDEDYVLEIMDQNTMRIKKELDMMREEEIKTYELTERSLEKL